MPKRLSDLPVKGRDLAALAIEYMDTLWDPSLRLIRYAPPQPSYYPLRRHRPPEAAPHHATRGTAWYALGLLTRNAPGDRDRAIQALGGVLRNQVDAPGKPYDGTWRLFDQSEEPDDPQTATDWRGWDSNWRQFIGLTLAVILDAFGHDLPAHLVTDLDVAIRRAVLGEIAEDRLHPTYTNIALMRAGLDVWAGVRYGKEDWLRRGESWAEEINSLFSLHDAFQEYNSPTYYGVDLYALGFWREYAPSAKVQNLGRAMERDLWRDIGALYHAGLRNLCGPFFRSYGMNMLKYPTGVGQQIWLAVGAERAPHPRDAQPGLRTNGLRASVLHARLGPSIPDDARPSLAAFQGPHAFNKTIMDEPPVSVSAWLGDDVMLGAVDTNGTRSAAGQFHPVTIHWRAPDREIYWMRMASGTDVDALATERTLQVRCSGDASFQVYAPSAEAGSFAASAWSLPGLTVAVESDGQQALTDRAWNAWRVSYPGATRFNFRV